MATNGINLVLYADGQAIAGTKVDDISTSAETIETSSPSSGPWRTHVTKRKEWSVSTRYLVMSASALSILGSSGIKDLLQAGNEFELEFKSDDDDGVKGNAILRTAKIASSVGSLVQGSFEFVGNGELVANESEGLE